MATKHQKHSAARAWAACWKTTVHDYGPQDMLPEDIPFILENNLDCGYVGGVSIQPVCWTWNPSLWSRVRQILRVYVSWMAMNWKETYENSGKKKRKGPGMGSSMHGRQVKSGRRWRGTGTLVRMGCCVSHSGARQRLRRMARHCMTKANNCE